MLFSVSDAEVNTAGLSCDIGNICTSLGIQLRRLKLFVDVVFKAAPVQDPMIMAEVCALQIQRKQPMMPIDLAQKAFILFRKKPGSIMSVFFPVKNQQGVSRIFQEPKQRTAGAVICSQAGLRRI